MKPWTAQARPVVTWGVAARPLEGQSVSGDAYLVHMLRDAALLAVADGLGHGEEAAAAARLALAVLEKSPNLPISELLRQCDQTLTNTRGAVMSLAFLDARAGTLAWVGIGNVEGRLLRGGRPVDRPTESVLLLSGVLGCHAPSHQPVPVRLTRGDLLLFATDGIRPGFADSLDPNHAPEHIARRILEDHFRGSDDALVLVARYLGTDHE